MALFKLGHARKQKAQYVRKGSVYDDQEFRDAVARNEAERRQAIKDLPGRHRGKRT